MQKKVKGTIGMLRVAHVYQLLEYNVMFPVGDMQKYDLVIEKNGQFERIQVKTVTERDGLIYADARVIGHNLKGVNIYKPEKTDFDILAVVEMKTQNVYAIPFDGTKRQFSLRTKAAKNGQKKNVHAAEKYLLMGP